MRARRKQMLRGYIVAMISIVAMLAGMPNAGYADSTSDAAAACRNGGFLEMTTATGGTFANVGECVRHAAQGHSYGDGGTTPEETPVVTPEPPRAEATLVITYHYFPVPEYGTCSYNAWLTDTTLEAPYTQIYNNGLPLFDKPLSTWREHETDPWAWRWSKTLYASTETYVVFYSGPSHDSEIIATTNTVTCAYEG